MKMKCDGDDGDPKCDGVQKQNICPSILFSIFKTMDCKTSPNSLLNEDLHLIFTLLLQLTTFHTCRQIKRIHDYANGMSTTMAHFTRVTYIITNFTKFTP